MFNTSEHSRWASLKFSIFYRAFLIPFANTFTYCSAYSNTYGAAIDSARKQRTNPSNRKLTLPKRLWLAAGSVTKDTPCAFSSIKSRALLTREYTEGFPGFTLGSAIPKEVTPTSTCFRPSLLGPLISGPPESPAEESTGFLIPAHAHKYESLFTCQWLWQLLGVM